MLPFSILRMWFLGLFGLAALGVGGYLLYDYYYDNGDRREMYWGYGLLAYALLPQLSVRPFLGGLTFGSTDPEPAVAPPQEHFVRGPHVKIQAYVYPNDQGPVYLLTHGWSLNHTIWNDILPSLLSRGEVITWDLRGLGRSDRPSDNDYSLEAMANDLAAVLQLAANRPVVLVGHSIGGMIAQTFCRLHSDQLGSRVTGLVLVDTSYTNPVRTAWGASLWQALQKPVLEPLLHLTIWLSPLVWLSNLSSYWNGSTHWTTRFTSFAGKQTWRQLDKACRLSAWASPAVMARGMFGMLHFDEQATHPAITIPVTVVSAMNDILTLPEANQHIVTSVPLGQFVPLDPGGHMSLLENAQPVAAAILTAKTASTKPNLAKTA